MYCDSEISNIVMTSFFSLEFENVLFSIVVFERGKKVHTILRTSIFTITFLSHFIYL